MIGDLSIHTIDLDFSLSLSLCLPLTFFSSFCKHTQRK